MIYITFDLIIKSDFSIFFDNRKFVSPYPNCYFGLNFDSHDLSADSDAEIKTIDIFKASESSLLFFNEVDTISDRISDDKYGTLEVEFIRNGLLWHSLFTIKPNGADFLERLSPYFALMKSGQVYGKLTIKLSTDSALALLREFDSNSEKPKIGLDNFEIRFHSLP